MPTRRQERIARVVREAVSDAIANHLSDPRIESFVSVTKVDISADMHIAHVYLSMFGGTETAQKKTFIAILHARRRIQMILGEQIKSRFCPVITLHKDENFKKTIETMMLIDDLANEFKDKDSIDQEHG